MYILAVDTAHGNASCAIIKDGKTVSFSIEPQNTLQAEKLFMHIEKVCKEAGISYNDIDHYSASLGPGSFTGIRIGLSAIIAMSFAGNKPFTGIGSLEALAYRNWIDKGNFNIITALNAGRNEVYSQNFEIDKKGVIKALNEGMLLPLGEIKNADIGNIEPAKSQYIPDARDIGFAAFNMITNNQADFNRKVPIYIRKPDAKIGANTNKITIKTN